MPVTHTWFIPGKRLDDETPAPGVSPSFDGKTDVIRSCTWTLESTDGVNTVTDWGEIEFPPLADGDFTPFDQVTLDLLKSWMFPPLNKADKESYAEKRLLDMANAPPILKPLVAGE